MTKELLNAWTWTDNINPEFRRDGSESMPIASEHQLRELLLKYCSQEPRVVFLKSTRGPLVSIAIGGPLAAIDFTNVQDLASLSPRSQKRQTRTKCIGS